MDKKVFEALASDTRIAILKELDQRQKTVTELADSLSMAKSSVHEHLSKMVDAGIIEKEDNERKWTYYRLTRKGRSILHPHETTKILVLIGSSILAFLGGVSQILKLTAPAKEVAMQKGVPSLPSPERGEEVLKGAEAVYVKEPLILGILLLITAILLSYFAYRIWRRLKNE